MKQYTFIQQKKILSGFLITLFSLFFTLDTASAQDHKPEAPTIEMIGAQKIILFSGEEYQEPGVKAFDSNNTELSVTSTATQFRSKNPGVYTISYAAVDANGNAAFAHRTIIVRSIREYLGNPLSVKKKDTRSVEVVYTNGENKIFHHTMKKNQTIQISKKKEGIIYNKKKKPVYRIDLYTGEKKS